MPVKGVDISEMNGNVDFAALRAAGVGFVLIRCGYGGDYPHQDDECFEENVGKAEAAGIPWGCYLYSYAKNTDMARGEARHTLRLLRGRNPAYGVWYDVEDASQSGCDLVSICEAYCTAIEDAGPYCGIYSMLSWLEGPLHSDRLNRYDKWVADWDDSCGYTKSYGIWQYSDSGNIGGKLFDMNLAYRDYPALTGNEEMEEEEMSYEQFEEYMARYEEKRARQGESDWSLLEGGWRRACEKKVFDGSAPCAPLTREQAAAVFSRMGLLDA